jgi:UDP-N-acetylmuramoyl-tripeptide--D-alanyl-D-alanine ligase
MPRIDAADFARWAGGQWTRRPVHAAEGVSTDSRTLQPGSLFIALRGDRFDGHQYLEQAFARGAAAAMVDAEEDIPPDLSDRPLLRVPNTREALLAAAAGWRRSLRAPFLGITGSVGKTTVKDLTASILGEIGPTDCTRGNWNNDVGLPLSLLAMEPDAQFGVFEVGMSRPGEIAALCSVLAPSHAVMTTVGAAHLEAFDSEAAIAEEKADLFRSLPPDGTAVLCRDQPWFDALRGAAPGPVVTTSSQQVADYRWERSSSDSRTFRVFETSSGEAHVLTAALPGSAFVHNVVLAIAVGRHFGASWSVCRQVAAEFTPSSMRWNQRQVDGVTVINDGYNANPLSMSEALRSLAEVDVAGRRWAVLGDMLELGAQAPALHWEVGRRAAACGVDGLILCGSWAGTMSEGARDAGFEPDRIEICEDCQHAAGVLREWVRPNDAILIKASRGLRLERVIELWEAAARPARSAEPPSCCITSMA